MDKRVRHRDDPGILSHHRLKSNLSLVAFLSAYVFAIHSRSPPARRPVHHPVLLLTLTVPPALVFALYYSHRIASHHRSRSSLDLLSFCSSYLSRSSDSPSSIHSPRSSEAFGSFHSSPLVTTPHPVSSRSAQPLRFSFSLFLSDSSLPSPPHPSSSLV